MPAAPLPGSITDVAGLSVGHASTLGGLSGCTVVLSPQGAVCGVDVRGAAPGTRETDLLHPGSLVQQVHAVLLSGGSAWGLDAASGVMAWLEEHGCGLETGAGRVPLVPAAVLFDLAVLDAFGASHLRPDAACGHAACAAASQQPVPQGNVGAGCGASVGKVFGMQHAMKGGIGSSSLRVRGVTVGALIACNALGDVCEPHSGRLLAGARTPDGRHLRNTGQSLLRGDLPVAPLAGSNTTIGVVATDAHITKPQAQRLAVCAHDGLARSIAPVHTPFDGDTLFALGTGASGKSLDLLTLCALAAEAVALATARAVLAARTLRSPGGLELPAAHELT